MQGNPPASPAIVEANILNGTIRKEFETLSIPLKHLNNDMLVVVFVNNWKKALKGDYEDKLY